MAREDFCLVVMGRGISVTDLEVEWDPTARRLVVEVPAALAEAFR